KKVSMLQMPQMVALLNGLGGAASAIVGMFAMFGIGSGFDVFSKITASIALAVGMLTLTGSLVAAGKLHKILPQKPVVWKHHQLITLASVVLMFAGIVIFSVLGAADKLGIVGGMFALIFLASGFFGFVFAIRVGGADMPITISLLNSLSGVAGAIAGLAIGDILLVAVGGIVGASGLLLTQIMCRAMNRSLFAILAGKTTSQPGAKHPVAAAPAKAEEKVEP
ncbi:MAG: NAD(P)(+) transhydrogenase (Re/Si-specific) subunit beta, partial [Clostridia bacterium]